jgi:hypothetical protein
MSGEKSEQFIIVRSWHLVILVLGLIVSSVLSYGKLQAQADESQRRIQDLEHKPVVTEFEFDMRMRALEQRLERIERKIDANHDK